MVDAAAWGGMLDNATVINTAGAGQLNFPNFDDTANVATLLTETTADTVKDLTFGTKQLDGYLYTSGIIKASVELLQDSAYDIESYLTPVMGRRIGSGLNGAFTTGDGSSKPNGVVTAATDSGVTTASDSAITYPELVSIIHQVDPAYRRNSKFSFNDNFLSIARKMVDSQNRPLWQASIREGQPDLIAGYPYFINQDMANMADSSAKFILFGDFTQYYIRMVGGIVISQSDEFYWSTRERGYVSYVRTDGDLIGDATAIVYADSPV
jgi:HK97 family phage major capsid protein